MKNNPNDPYLEKVLKEFERQFGGSGWSPFTWIRERNQRNKSIESFITHALLTQRNEIKERIEGETFKKVGSWYKVPIRKGLKMTKNIDGTGGLVNAGCEVCGGRLVYVRGRFPGEKRRKTCPTCALEIIEGILDNCNNRQAYTTAASRAVDGEEKE